MSNPNNCETCDYKKLNANREKGHCYMFRDAPTEVCMQHTGRQPVFSRRWTIASDGFGLQRDDDNGNYVSLDDALDVLHRALTANERSNRPASAGPVD